LLFAVVGPLVGLAGLLGGLVIQDPSRAHLDLRLALPLVGASYVFGVMPALVTGVGARTLRNKLDRYSGGLLCGVVGALTSAALWVVLPRSPLPWTSIALLGILPGGVAGLACGLVYFWSPENLFRQKPLRSLA
jgi:hypothetical protein